MHLIQYDDLGQIVATLVGHNKLFFETSPPILQEGATKQRLILAQEAEILTDNPTNWRRYYVEEYEGDGIGLLRVAEKTPVRLSFDKTEIAGDDTDTATLTLDTQDEVVLWLNGVAQEQQAYPDGVEFTSEDPRMYTFEVNDARHYSDMVQLLVRHVMPPAESPEE